MSDRKNSLSRANIPDWAFVLYPLALGVLLAVVLALALAIWMVLLDQILGALCG